MVWILACNDGQLEDTEQFRHEVNKRALYYWQTNGWTPLKTAFGQANIERVIWSELAARAKRLREYLPMASLQRFITGKTANEYQF